MQSRFFGKVLESLQRWKELFWQNRRRICTCGVILGIGMIYYVITQLTPFRIPCVFQTVTGFACPGCGVSHFCMRLLHFDFIGAARENLGLTVLLPVWCAAGIVRLIWHPQWLAKNSKGESLLLWGSIVLLILFGVVRNLPGMEFLLPSYRR